MKIQWKLFYIIKLTENIISRIQNSFSINYIKTNDNSSDNIKVNLGSIRLNI